MNPRNLLIFVGVVTNLVAWWQIETRISAAHDLHGKLALEAIHDARGAEQPPLGANASPFGPSPDPLEATPMLLISELENPSGTLEKEIRNKP
jgi:hypothetical protein